MYINQKGSRIAAWTGHEHVCAKTTGWTTPISAAQVKSSTGSMSTLAANMLLHMQVMLHGGVTSNTLSSKVTHVVVWMLPEATLQNGSASGTSSSNGYLPDARAETCTASEILAALSASADGDVKTLRRARRRFMSSKMQLVSASWVLDSLAALEQEGDHARRKTELAYTPAAAAAGQAPVKQEQEAQATAGVSAGDGVGDVGGASAAAAAAAADDDDITTTSRVKRRRKLPAIHTSTPSTGSKGDGTVLPAHVKDGDMPEPAKMSSAPADGGLDIARWPWYEVGVMAADGGSSDTSAGKWCLHRCWNWW